MGNIKPEPRQEKRQERREKRQDRNAAVGHPIADTETETEEFKKAKFRKFNKVKYR